MIPQVIHYCWFGGKPLPSLAEKCIASWKKFFPGYEIKRWDESNFDVNAIPYTAQAYSDGIFAFVSDYARFWILYKYGGLYFDTDVEVIKTMDDIVAAGPFMGCENLYQKGATPIEMGVAPGLGLGVNPGLGLYNDILNLYRGLEFRNASGSWNEKTVVDYVTELLCLKGLKNAPDIQKVDGVYIYPKDYFCPIDYKTGKFEITNNTRTIHHYSASWQTPTAQLAQSISYKLTFIPYSLRGYVSKVLATYRLEGFKSCIKLVRDHLY